MMPVLKTHQINIAERVKAEELELSMFASVLVLVEGESASVDPFRFSDPCIQSDRGIAHQDDYTNTELDAR